MEKYKKITKAGLPEFINSLLQSGKTVVAPVKTNGRHNFARVTDLSRIDLDYIQTGLSAKSVVFPRCEELFSYLREGNEIKVNSQNGHPRETVIFGLRPCDAAAFDYLKHFFLNGNPDYHFKMRLDHTTIIALSCKECDDYCFCTSVGLDPGSTKGSDILLTEINGDTYYAEINTEKGDALAASKFFADTNVTGKIEHLAKPAPKFDPEIIRNKVEGAYNSPVWAKASLACVACGTCAFACPTCTCFDIQDETNPSGGVRLRNWDACAQSLFTVHASGHNPREVQGNRWKHRIFHKFKYSVDNLGEVSCVGCGRCIRMCPAGMNILENLALIGEM